MKIRLAQNERRLITSDKSLIVVSSVGPNHYSKELPTDNKLLAVLNSLIPKYMNSAIYKINSEIISLTEKRATLMTQFRKDYYELVDQHQKTNPEYYI